ncbi:MAG: hypothetical protein KGJ52_08315, partial [Gammaproteobacteria bacterium]|nr:hypothetical protein [Gammaproteobacteria bacterium]
MMGKAPDGGKRSKQARLAATTAKYSNMLLAEGADDRSIAFPEQLERSRLDFTLASLRALDRYLDRVRIRQDGLEGYIHLNTVVAVACYLGEVIRRGTPAGECQWVRAANVAADGANTGVHLGDFADVVLAVRGSVRPLRLTRVVARYVSSKGYR